MEIIEPKRDFSDFEREIHPEDLHDAGQKKLLAGILGIVIPGIGLHKFILGYVLEGILALLFTILTCGLFSLIGIIESIIYLTKTDREFYLTYIANERRWF